VTRVIRIVGVGAHLPTGGPRGRVQRLPRGWQGELPDEIAEKWVAAGVAVLVNGGDEKVEVPGGGSAEPKPIADMTGKELRAFAAAHDPVISIPASATKVADIRQVVADALATTTTLEPNEGTGGDELPDPLPADLGELTDGQLLALAVEWELEVPEDADGREQLLELVRAHAAEHTEPAE
jgi:hypothetical protein